MRTNAELRKAARQALEGNWCKGVWVTLLTLLITGTLTYGISYGKEYNSIWLILCFPLLYGFEIYFLEVIRKRIPSTSFLFAGYKEFLRITITMLLEALYTMLWMLLLIIPGIIKSFSYSMTQFVMRDHPELKYDAAISESSRLMKGNKMKLFMLYLSFIGWYLLCLLTLGIGFFLFIPYVNTSIAAFYEDLLEEDRLSNPEYVPFTEEEE